MQEKSGVKPEIPLTMFESSENSFESNDEEAIRKARKSSVISVKSSKKKAKKPLRKRKKSHVGQNTS